jgi:hypothetical protein
MRQDGVAVKKRIIGELVIAAAVLVVDEAGDGSAMGIVDPNSDDSCFYKVEVRN